MFVQRVRPATTESVVKISVVVNTLMGVIRCPVNVSVSPAGLDRPAVKVSILCPVFFIVQHTNTRRLVCSVLSL